MYYFWDIRKGEIYKTIINGEAVGETVSGGRLPEKGRRIVMVVYGRNPNGFPFAHKFTEHTFNKKRLVIGDGSRVELSELTLDVVENILKKYGL